MKNQFRTITSIVIFISILFIVVFNVFDVPGLSSSVKTTFAPVEYSLKVPNETETKPRNIIIFVADGMGFAHLSLAQLTQQEGPKVWQAFEINGWHDPRCSYGPLTDSGASATAIATGVATFFEVIGLDPDGNHLVNLLEMAQDSSYLTGIVTDSYIWDATPAAFVAHTQSRDNAKDILQQIAASELDLIFGELEDLGEGEVPGLETTMNIINQRFLLLNESLDLPAPDSVLQPIAAIYEEDEVQDVDSNPNLTQLTETALNYLGNREQPFILLVESEEIDASSHDNNSKRMLRGLESIQQTLAYILEFAEDDGETLVLFTSDHETGGLSLVSDSGIYPDLELIWSTFEHTASVVPILAKGPGATQFSDVHRNYEIGILLKSLITSQ